MIYLLNTNINNCISKMRYMIFLKAFEKVLYAFSQSLNNFNHNISDATVSDIPTLYHQRCQ